MYNNFKILKTMDEQYFINEELLDILHECGMVKTEKELIKEKEQKEALKEKEAEEQKEDNEEFENECPVMQELEDIKTSIDSLNDSLTIMNDCMVSFGKTLKSVLTHIQDND